MKRNNGNRGFTLMELIVVIGVLAVPATIGTVILNQVMDTWRAESTRTELDSRAQYIFSQMKQDIAETISARLAGEAMNGLENAAADPRYHRVQLENDSFSFQAVVPGTNGQLQHAEVGYYVDRETSPCTLMRTVRLPGTASAVKQAVAEGVLAMRVEYAGAQGWQQDWPRASAANPEAVRVSLVLMDPDRNWEQVSRRAVFPVHVN